MTLYPYTACIAGYFRGCKNFRYLALEPLAEIFVGALPTNQTGPSTGISPTNVAHCLNKLQVCLKEASEDVAGIVHSRGYAENHNVYCIYSFVGAFLHQDCSRVHPAHCLTGGLVSEFPLEIQELNVCINYTQCHVHFIVRSVYLDLKYNIALELLLVLIGWLVNFFSLFVLMHSLHACSQQVIVDFASLSCKSLEAWTRPLFEARICSCHTRIGSLN